MNKKDTEDKIDQNLAFPARQNKNAWIKTMVKFHPKLRAGEKFNTKLQPGRA